MHILFDIGKTKMRIAGSQDLASFGDPKIFDTPKDYDEFIRIFVDAAREIAGGKRIESLSGGVGSKLSSDKTEILIDELNFSEWRNGSIVRDISHNMEAPTFLENDAALAALGEAAYGAGRSSRIVAYITVSTGVGGARVVDGKIDANAQGFEPGRQVLSLLETKYATEYLSGVAVESATGKEPAHILDEDFWDEKAKTLAVFLNNIIVLWSPHVVVLGGSMMNEVGIPIPATAEYLRKICKIFPELPPLKHSELGDLGGLWGALELLRQDV